MWNRRMPLVIEVLSEFGLISRIVPSVMCKRDSAGTGDAGGSGSSSATPSISGTGSSSEDAGMWLSLSQIQEWIVEFSCDMLFISLRTDVAWYRLSKCASTFLVNATLVFHHNCIQAIPLM